MRIALQLGVLGKTGVPRRRQCGVSGGLPPWGSSSRGSSGAAPARGQPGTAAVFEGS